MEDWGVQRVTLEPAHSPKSRAEDLQKRDNGQGYSTEGILLPKLRFSRNCRGCREADLHHMPRS